MTKLKSLPSFFINPHEVRFGHFWSQQYAERVPQFVKLVNMTYNSPLWVSQIA